jgi:hypothetical protein
MNSVTPRVRWRRSLTAKQKSESRKQKNGLRPNAPTVGALGEGARTPRRKVILEKTIEQNLCGRSLCPLCLCGELSFVVILHSVSCISLTLPQKETYDFSQTYGRAVAGGGLDGGVQQQHGP